MPFYLQSSKFRSRVIPFLERVEKDISIWLNSPIQFKIVASYLDIISILDVTGDQNTITLPLNIAKDNIHVTLHVYFHETSASMRFHIELENSWTIPQRLIPHPQIIPLCSAITSPALLRRLKHYKGTKQVEFLQLTSLFLSKSDGHNMFYTHDIIYDDQAVAFVDVATQRQIHNQLQNTGINLPPTTTPTTTSLAVKPPTPHISTTKPTLAAQLENLKVLVRPSQTTPPTTSTSPRVRFSDLDKTKEIPQSPKPQTHRKKVQPDKPFHPDDSDGSDCDTLLKDKYLLNPKSFMASTLKDLTELNCSKPTQPDLTKDPYLQCNFQPVVGHPRNTGTPVLSSS